MESKGQPGSELRERFYQSVAETLTLLHAAPGHDRRQALRDVASTLAITMDLPLVWIGRRDLGHSRLEVIPAGPAADYASSLRVSDDEREPSGRGPVGLVLREGRARVTRVEAPEYAPWREAARRYGFGSSIVAASGTSDGGQLVLAVYSHEGGPELTDELLDWAQRLADELARFWDDQALLERNLHLARYRDAHRALQRAMLDQPEPTEIYRTLAEILVEVAAAAAVVVYVPEGETLRRIALVGAVAEAIGALPEPPTHADGPSVLTPTLTFMQGVPTVRIGPSTHPDVSIAWRTEPLARMAAIGCWPIFSTLATEPAPASAPAAVFLVVAAEVEAFDADMRELLDEIADTAGLALRQHKHHRALFEEQERQTYLALHDALTDLPNRRALDEHLERALVRAERHQRLVAVGMLDLDDLKPINDRHGHAVGDGVLIEVASRLHAALRSEDYVARLGGDEFVLVFEDLANEDDLDVLLDRLWQSLQQSIVVGEVVIHITVSLGIAIYPTHAKARGEQLLRLADQAMYVVKSNKRQRSNWWTLAFSDAVAGSVAEDDLVASAPHGKQAAVQLQSSFNAWQLQLPVLVEHFYTEMSGHPGLGTLLETLPPSAVHAFKSRLSRHLCTLFYPALDAGDQRLGAIRAGVFHAASGVEDVWLLEAMEQLRETFASVLGSGLRADRKVLSILLQRLGLEQQWQLESMRSLQRRRGVLLAAVNTVAWAAEGYQALMEGVVRALASHEEIVACAAGRPDHSGRLVYETVAGRVPAEYLRVMNSGMAPLFRIEAGVPEGDGPAGCAWRTAEIHRSVHHGSDPAMMPWRDAAMRHGVVSHVAVPLGPLPQKPLLVLILYSSYAGGFRSENQQAFVEQIKSVLDLALTRLRPSWRGAVPLPFFVRDRWRAMIATDALQMHYQPMVRLVDGRVAGLEALARLRDEVGTLLLPAMFLPALGSDDLMLLFRSGLAQALSFRQSLAEVGSLLSISVNVPSAALQDPRYAQTAEAALQAGSHPAEALLFEVLESPVGAGHWELVTGSGAESLKALGVGLVENDLDGRPRSLLQLRRSPFDRIKIDQTVITRIKQDPLGTLRNMRQLIHVGHELGLEVVVEGIESPDMIEAASILGADFGQGYALGRPMPPEALSGWLASFQPGGPAACPTTGLGALAGALLWDEQFASLPDEQDFRRRHAQSSCIAGAYMRHARGVSSALRSSHEAMHKAAMGGPLDADYRRQRDMFFSLLVEHALDQQQHHAGNVGETR
ncbi:MAG: diguanylate cyclase [Rhodanobacter sp.]|nr:MAG: diguanylate cyclase [Rhodanobacter sp.]